MATENKNVEVSLTFKDKATGKFVKAQQTQVKALKAMGVQVDKTGKSYKIRMEQVAKATEKAGQAQAKLRVRTSALHKTMANLQFQVSRLRNVILLYYFAYRPLENIIKSVTEASLDQERAEASLAAAIMATKKVTDEQRKSLLQQASALQNITGISDNQIIKAQALLVQHRLTNEQIVKATPLLVDMTAALRASGKETQTVADTAKVMGNALSGRLTTLRSYGIHLSEDTLKLKTFDLIMRDVENSVGGMGKAMGATFEGNINKTKEAFGDFTEKIGDSITGSDILASALDSLAGTFVELGTAVGTSNDKSDNFENSWINLLVILRSTAETMRILGSLVRLSYTGWKMISVQIQKSTKLIDLVPWKLLGIHVNAVAFALKTFSLIKGPDLNTDELTAEMERLTIEADKAYAALNPKNAQNNVKTYMDGVLAQAKLFREENEKNKAAMEAITKDTKKEVGELTAWADMTTTIGNSMKSEISDGALKVIKGELVEINTIVARFGNVVLKAVIEGMVEWLAYSIKIQMINAATSSGGGMGGAILKGALAIGGAVLGLGAGSGAGASALQASYNAGTGGTALQSAMNVSNFGVDTSGFGASALAFHTGGYVKKYHSGGRTDETPAMLLQGEGVLNKGAMKDLGVNGLNRLNRGAESSCSVINNYYNINAIDRDSFREHMAANSDIAVSATEADMRNNGSMRKTTKEVM